MPSQVLACITAALFAVTAIAEPNGFQNARDLYYKGIYGDKSAVAQADELFTQLHGQAPKDPLVEVYYGSLRLLEAEHTWALWKKNSLSKEGVTLMDEAVSGQPASLEIRFVRAATERNLPSFFGRKQQAENDINVIVKTAEQAVSAGTLEPRLAAASFYYYGLNCEGKSDGAEALMAWRTAVRIAPDSHSGRLAAEKLKQIR